MSKNRKYIFSLTIMLSIFLLSSCASSTRQSDTSLQSCETIKSIPSMGSFFEVQLAHSCQSPVPAEIYLEIKNRLDTLETELSLYQTESAISSLNRTGSVSNITPDFLALLEISKDYYQKTNGAFNIAILPILRGQKIPPQSEILKVENVKWQKNGDGTNKVWFTKKGMQITFDGVAKGYAVDRIAELLELKGQHNYLVNFSGNMRWRGQSKEQKPWHIAVWDPVRQKIDPLPDRHSGAIATSGQEHQKGHLIDPRTGKATSQGPTSVSAMGPSATICDILSTTFYLQNEGERVELIQKLNGAYRAHVIP